ncbi:glutaredoxin 3 [Gammaproteobacteria bacterium]|nr:glutaredoxin 3 [Gammaproteobacteria bacterium]
MPQVLLYGTRFCPFCAAARHLLTAKNVQYDDISVDDDQTLRAKIFTQSGQRTVPQIWIGETHIGGYSELQALETKGELDLLLSPGLN